jgi:hypothetical protein
VGEHPKLPEVEAKAVGDTGVYTCPMHPQIVRSEPGTCPICGMALEPRDVAMDDEENAELVDMRRRLWVPLRKPSSEQIQSFMIFTKCPISRLFITSRRRENGSTMNFATKPQIYTRFNCAMRDELAKFNADKVFQLYDCLVKLNG